MTPRLAIGGLAWASALTLSALFADVGPWSGGLALLLAAASLAPRLELRHRIVLAGAASVPVLAAGSHLPGCWALLALGTISTIGERWRPRVAVGAALAILAVAAGQLGLGIAPVAAIGALVALATPGGRWVGAPPLGLGAIGFVIGIVVTWRVATEPLVEAAALVERRAAWRLEPVLAERAALALDAGDLEGAKAVVRAVPGAIGTGLAVARARGIDEAVDAGWAPQGPLEPEIALALAWSLHDRGRTDEAIAVLDRQPGPVGRVHRAAVEAEWTRTPHLPTGPYPEEVPVAPGLLLSAPSLSGAASGEVVLVAPGGIADLVVHADVADGYGAPELTLTIDGSAIGPIPLDGEVAVPVPVDLAPGAWRLGWTIDPVGAMAVDTEVHALRIEAR